LVSLAKEESQEMLEILVIWDLLGNEDHKVQLDLQVLLVVVAKKEQKDLLGLLVPLDRVVKLVIQVTLEEQEQQACKDQEGQVDYKGLEVALV
jgi:hypothetical protein